MTDLLLQKGEQISQAGKAFALPRVGILEGSPPDLLPPALGLPQTQQVGDIAHLFPAHLDTPSLR